MALIFASGRLGSRIFNPQRVQLTGLREKAYHLLLPQCVHAGVAQETADDRFSFFATRFSKARIDDRRLEAADCKGRHGHVDVLS